MRRRSYVESGSNLATKRCLLYAASTHRASSAATRACHGRIRAFAVTMSRSVVRIDRSVHDLDFPLRPFSPPNRDASPRAARGVSAGWACLVFCAFGLGLASRARAEDPPSARTVQVAPKVSYEQQRTDRILEEQKLEVEPNPEGKRIAFIRIVRDDVFVRDEIWPLWFNWFHGLTREKVVRRELLFEKGIPYVNARIEETMRNLRGMGIFALVRITPVKAARDGEVGILVLTRDLWSLRLETDYEVTNKLSSFHLAGREVNAFGHNKRLSVDYTLIPKSYELSQTYYARRVLLSSVALSEKAGLVFRRGTNHVEGEVGSLEVGQPYYKLAQRWAWIASYSHDRRVQRYTRRGEIQFFPDQEADPHALMVYRSRQENAELYGSFRIGERTKNSFYLGWDYRSLRVNPIAETQLPDSLRDQFRRKRAPQRADRQRALLHVRLLRHAVGHVREPCDLRPERERERRADRSLLDACTAQGRGFHVQCLGVGREPRLDLGTERLSARSEGVRQRAPAARALDRSKRHPSDPWRDAGVFGVPLRRARLLGDAPPRLAENVRGARGRQRPAWLYGRAAERQRRRLLARELRAAHLAHRVGGGARRRGVVL